MSPSKTFNLPGLNFAFAIVADPELRGRFQQPGEGLSAVPRLLRRRRRRGGVPPRATRWLAELLGYLRGNRDLVEQFVAESLPSVTMTHVEATYLAWLDVRRLDLADAAAACERAGVALSAGAAFGGARLSAPQLRLPAEHPGGGARRLDRPGLRHESPEFERLCRRGARRAAT